MQRCRNLVACARRSYSTALPWFVDQSPVPHPPHLPRRVVSTPPLPDNTPSTLRELHAQLAQSPHLDASTLVVSEAIPRQPGPPLPPRKPQGRRKRGGTYAGNSVYDVPGGLWNWVVMAQVKEGTESKGAIESVVRVIRKALLSVEPPLPLPPNSKRRMHNGWAMVDAGDFAVHVLSKEAREKYFSERVEW
ncbi:putative ribosomal silencing factor during starvation [Lyophyllum shimeji]|uniref:Ribosomal silencing factor during starvation n=1 Tax=Lyophyllum shimeji TaxID=47721 RepID=A0A9P3UJ33_LYOSH|nr:putative ribosomal silencing factor during starvation [Lyophyllum shimeji]